MITINRPPEQRWIELGCGNNPHPACQVHVDVRSGPGIDFSANFDEPLPIKDQDFDGVLSIFCIEHLSWRKVRQFVSELHRILKPGGKAIIITANTEAQMRRVLASQEWGDEESRIIFGDLDYPENSHKNSLSPRYATKLFSEAGFVNITIRPFGEIETDMLIEATKLALSSKSKSLGPMPPEANAGRTSRATLIVACSGQMQSSGLVLRTFPEAKPDSVIEPNSTVAAQQRMIDQQMIPKHFEPVIPNAVIDLSPEAKFDSKYFNGIGYEPFYWDFPCHEITFRHVMARKPESVLELGCGRGYVIKRLEDAGIAKVAGLDVSKHCYMTRAAKKVYEVDLLKPWSQWKAEEGQFDLCFSISFLEHVPEKDLLTIFAEMERTCKRGLHGVTFAGKDDGKDRTRLTIQSKEWWQERLPRGHEVVAREDLENGDLPEVVIKGDGRVKLNVGCYMTQFHHGWKNIDVHDLTGFAQTFRYDFQRCDVRQGLAFDTGSVDLIYAAHMLEHLTYAEGLTFLRECRRVLKPDTGAMRILVPDAGKLISEWYEMPRGEALAEYGHMNDGCAEAPTAAGKLWALLLENHKAVYDFETLAWYLEQAGFIPKQSTFRDDERFKECVDMLPCLSLVATGTPLVG